MEAKQTYKASSFEVSLCALKSQLGLAGLDQKNEVFRIAMGWNRKGKFGIHTGRTLRNFPNENAKKCDEFAIVKELKFTDPMKQLSFDKKRVDELDVDDGGLHLGDGHIVYSMNKHKRWLLPDMVKEEVEQLYWDAISECEQQSSLNSGSRKSCKTPKNQDNQVPKLQVTVVERHAGNNIERSRPDCIGVTSSCSGLNSSKLNRKPRKTYAFVGDLKPKTGSEDEALDAELCYEFLSPFPKKCWPLKRQFAWRYNYDFSGTKAKKKCKGRRNKWHRRPNVEKDDDDFISQDCDEVDDEESGNFLDSASPCDFPIGTYIENMLKCNSPEKHTCLPVKSKKRKSQKNSNPALYGKGDAIYVENDNDISHDISGNLSNQAMTEEIGPLIVDKKMTFGLSLDDITPDNLSQQFGSSYIEGNISPRKFIIKAEVNENVSSYLKDTEECCLLFELGDSLSSFVEADVSVLVPSEHEKPNNLVKVLQSELGSLSDVGPLTVKAIVDHMCEKIMSETTCLARNSVSKQAAPSIAKVLVEYIHNVSERKPEICEMRDAVRYSVRSTVAEENHVQSQDVTNFIYKPARRFCEICFTEGDTKLGTDFTSLLRCSHGFCNDCWAVYLMSCISLGQTCITCPHFQCETVIGEPLVWSQTNSEVYRRYTKLKHHVVIGMDRKFRHCPAANCTHIAYIDSSTESSPGLPILCVCGQMWCFGCQKDSHWPASCEEAKSFRNKCDDYESLKKTYRLPGRISSVQVKRCPFCSYPIEKDRGCQHMSCHCGNDFCWECLSPWSSHNWNKCDASRKELEDVELAFDLGSARFRKYSKIAVDNFLERNGKRISAFRRLTRKAKNVRKYSENSQETFLERIFHFKYLAHVVLENSAATLAISKTKIMLKSLDKYMHRLEFIIQRLNEIVYHPTIRLDANNIENVELLLSQGEQLIRKIHGYTRARRNTKIKFGH